MTYYKNSLFISYSKARGFFLGLSAILFLFLFTNSSEAFFHKKEKNLNTENTEITEDLYSKMNDKHIDAAAENLLIALETKSDNQRHRWVQGSFEGYIIPFSTFINELGYFCRDYVEVIVRHGRDIMFMRIMLAEITMVSGFGLKRGLLIKVTGYRIFLIILSLNKI